MDEEALIGKAQEGDLNAFNQLVRAYEDRVYNTAYRIMGDPASASDATQEAFISAYQAIDGFRGGSFKSWLLRIVTNACYDELRARKRHPTASLDALLVESESPGEYPAELEAPEDYAEREEMGRVIQQGLQTLPDEQRTTLVLVDMQGLSYDEAAEATDVALGTVKSRLSRAREKLRDYLLDQGELLPARYRLNDARDPQHAS